MSDPTKVDALVPDENWPDGVISVILMNGKRYVKQELPVALFDDAPALTGVIQRLRVDLQGDE